MGKRKEIDGGDLIVYLIGFVVLTLIAVVIVDWQYRQPLADEYCKNNDYEKADCRGFCTFSEIRCLKTVSDNNTLGYHTEESGLIPYSIWAAVQNNTLSGKWRNFYDEKYNVTVYAECSDSKCVIVIKQEYPDFKYRDSYYVAYELDDGLIRFDVYDRIEQYKYVRYVENSIEYLTIFDSEGNDITLRRIGD